MAGPTVVSVSPSSGATGVPTNVSISVTFDQEVDTYRLKNGGIFLEGPDESKTIGPSGIGNDPATTDEDEFLSSPGLKGIKPSTFEFLRVDGSGNEVNYYDYGDTGSAGVLYRTKVVITPDKPLAALTQYTVYIVGDEDITDDYNFGLTSRSVFDPQKGANTGNGEALFYGGYTGSLRQQFSVEITSAGASGTAEYEWWTSTDPLHKTARTSPSYRVLKDGVKVKFLDGLTYAVGDTFTVWCDVPEYMDGASKYSFTTSSYEAETIPASSTPLSGSGGTGTSTSSLSISSTTPEDRQPFVDTTLTTITVVFSAALDATTVTDSTVTVTGNAADGSTSGNPQYTETITKSLSVSSSTLTITLDADQLYDNNVVVVTLDSTISDTDDNTLGTDYEFFFSTAFAPFYAGVRHVRLRLGSLGNYFPDETIAFAIWDASREADAFAPSTIHDTTQYNRARTQFVVCFAAWVLSSSSGSISGSVRKRLGDFDVSRSEGSGSTGLDDTLKDCWEYYYGLLVGGGELARNFPAPQGVVKGDECLDEPNYGRLWDLPTQISPIVNNKVLYTGERRWYSTFVRKSGKYRRW